MSEPTPPAWNPGPEDRVVEVAKCSHEMEAAAVSDALTAAGIVHRVVGSHLHAWAPEVRFGAVTDPAIWTLERDAAAAHEVVAAFRTEHAAARAARPDQD